MTAADELELAQACARGDDAALERFEREYLAPTTEALRKKFGADTAQEATQRLRLMLLVPAKPGRPPGLLDFRGTGPLKAWLRVTASRLALEVLQSGKLPANYSDAKAISSRDDELQALATRYGPLLEEAFAAALEGLERRERLALKLHTLEQLPLEKIAAIFHVNASSVSRWLNAARQSLHERTLALLEERLSLSPASARKLLGQLQGEWDVSLRRLL
ncbi:MAG: hypothetical protein K1X89_03160 [Myxococcaceae bacterium]|nr:hypothetical protein [Myxococcaceae bacterium]